MAYMRRRPGGWRWPLGLAGRLPTVASGIMFQAASRVRLAALSDSPLRALLPFLGSTLQAGR